MRGSWDLHAHYSYQMCILHVLQNPLNEHKKNTELYKGDPKKFEMRKVFINQIEFSRIIG